MRAWRTPHIGLRPRNPFWYEPDRAHRLILVGFVVIEFCDCGAHRIDGSLRHAGRQHDQALHRSVDDEDGPVDVPKLARRLGAFDLPIKFRKRRDREPLDLARGAERLAVVDRIVPDRDGDAGLHQSRHDLRAVTRRRLAVQVDLALLQREPRRRAAAIAGDIAVFHAEHVESEADHQILGILRPEPAGDDALRLGDVGGSLDAGRDVGAGEDDADARLVGEELECLERHAEFLRRHDLAPRRAGEIAHHGAVFGRDLAEVIGADHAAGAVHVLHDDAGLAGDVPDEMFGENPPLDIRRSAGGKVYDDVDALPFVVGLVRVSGRQQTSAAKSPRTAAAGIFTSRPSSCSWR